MIKNVHRKWFEVWGAEQAQNQILKGFLAIISLLLLVFALSTWKLAFKEPTVIAVTPGQTCVVPLLKPSPNAIEQETMDTLKAYLVSRHTWTPETIKEAVKKGEAYVEPRSLRKYRGANRSQIKIALKRKISQKFYVYEVEHDKEDRSAILKVDRVLNVDGARSTSAMVFRLSYNYGVRSPENPQGIYIADEELINSVNH